MVIVNELNIRKFSRRDITKLELIKNGSIGNSSKVYKLNDLECIKIYNKSRDEYELYRLNGFTKLKYEHVIMPNTLVIINNKFKGYTMNYVNGNMLCDCLDLDFSFALKKYNDFVKDVTSEIENDGIILYDCNASNVIYDNDNQCFKLIDCDEWAIHIGSKASDMFQNYRMLFSTFNYLVTNEYNASEYDSCDFIDYFEHLRKMKEKKLSRKIKTLGDSILFFISRPRLPFMYMHIAHI